jgi:hypothetical protein
VLWGFFANNPLRNRLDANVGSAHPALRVLYCVTDSRAARGAGIASLFDRCFLTFSTCPPTPNEKFRHAARTHDTTQTVVREPDPRSAQEI